MKIETKYSVGDTVFLNHYSDIKKGKVIDVNISANNSHLRVTYEVNYAPSWYEMFSFKWSRYICKFKEEDLYRSIDEIAEKDISRLQYEIDINLNKIRNIKEEVAKQKDNEKHTT